MARMTRSLGLLQVATATDGSPVYIAAQGEDTSALYEVGTDPNDNILYANNPSAQLPSSTDWASVLAQVAQAGAQIYQTKTLTDVNAKRLSQGLQPLTAAQTAALQPGVNVGLSPATQQLLLWGGVAILGVWLFTSRRGG